MLHIMVHYGQFGYEVDYLQSASLTVWDYFINVNTFWNIDTLIPTELFVSFFFFGNLIEQYVCEQLVWEQHTYGL